MVLALGVLMLVPLQPILQSSTLAPAFDKVVPALFGAMAYQYYRKDLKLSLAPLVLMSALFIFMPALASQTSLMIIPSGAFAIILAYIGFRKRQNKEKAE